MVGRAALDVAPNRGPRMTRRAGEGKPEGWPQGCGQFFDRTGTSCRQTPQPDRAPGGCSPEGASSGGHFLLVTFLYSGHPALRPSGRLRRSHALLRMRGQAKKSDPASGRRTEARGRRARSRYRDNRRPRLWMTSHSAVEKRLRPAPG